MTQTKRGMSVGSTHKKPPAWDRWFEYCVCLFSDLLFDAGSLAMLTFQVIQLCSPHATGFQYFDLVDRRRYYREDTLYANAVGHLAYGKRLAIGAAAFALDYSALKLLNTLLITFFDLHVNIHRVA